MTLFDSGAVETRDIAADRLEEELGQVRYRGGTSYGSLNAVNVASGADCLMFSDGRVTIDDRRGFSLALQDLHRHQRAGKRQGLAVEISGRTGGAAINLGGSTRGLRCAGAVAETGKRHSLRDRQQWRSDRLCEGGGGFRVAAHRRTDAGFRSGSGACSRRDERHATFNVTRAASRRCSPTGARFGRGTSWASLPPYDAG